MFSEWVYTVNILLSFYVNLCPLTFGLNHSSVEAGEKVNVIFNNSINNWPEIPGYINSVYPNIEWETTELQTLT